MTPALRVAAAGLLTTIQDLGRPGYQRLGVPVSGALDPIGLRAANVLLDNPPGTGALEVAYIGPTLVAEADDVRLAVAGAPADIEVLPDASAPSGTRVDGMRTVRLRRGAALRIGSLAGAAVLYVAVEGGFDVAPVLGSVATDLRSRLGGWQGRALMPGDRLPLRRGASDRPEVCLEGFDLARPDRIRVMPGPQDARFSPAEISRFLTTEFRVAPASSRMAMYLGGATIQHAAGFDITSDAIAPGSIQVTGSGQPIVLLADRQTTGGYPKIATVISADVPAVSRLPIGARVRFEAVSAEVAEAARRRMVADIEQIKSKVVPIDSRDTTRRLLECNLISGVVSAAA